MKYGLFSGVLWGLDTVILGIGLALAPYIGSVEALALPPSSVRFYMMRFALYGCLVIWAYAIVLPTPLTPSKQGRGRS